MKTGITKCIHVRSLPIVILVVSIAANASGQALPVDRTVLPLAEPSYPPITEAPTARGDGQAFDHLVCLP
jgi:hypothetical protein